MKLDIKLAKKWTELRLDVNKCQISGELVVQIVLKCR